MNCPDCDRPIATNADSFDPILNPDDGEGSDTLCWRHWNQHNACDGTPVDWRARCESLDAENTSLVEQLFTQATDRDIDAGFAASAQAGAEWQARRAEAAEARLAIYEANHGARCDEARERYATFVESACGVLRRVLELAGGVDGWGACEVIVKEVGTFLSLPCHDVPGLRAKVAARDAALEACQQRIAGLLAALATERDKARAVADALASQNATLQATVLVLLAMMRPLDQAHIDVLRDMLDECERWMEHEESSTLRDRAAALRAVLGVADV